MDQKFLYYPVRQNINPSNLFGENPAQYKPLGQTGHPGNDFECPMFTPVYAPCDGDAFYTTDSLGGDGIYIRTPSGNPVYSVILWHMVPPGDPVHPYSIPTNQFVTTKVKAGDLLGYSGNSGFPRESTGPHLHLGIMPLNTGETALYPNNGTMGCVDPGPFYNGLFAEDIHETQAVQAIVATTIPLTQKIVSDPSITPQQKISFLTTILSFLKNLMR